MKDMTIMKEKMICDLAELIKIPSITEDRDACKKALGCVLSKAAELGMNTRSVCGGQVGEIEIGQGEETVGVLVHVDVVHPGISENWDTDPFVLTRKADCIYGRGVQDDKGPLIAALYAMKSVLDEEKPLHKTIRMIIGTREETDWEDMNQYVNEYDLPDYGFTPDGDFPICNIEKGILELDFSVPYDQTRTNGWHLTSINSGDMNNTVPGKAYAELTLYESGKPVEVRNLQASGKSIHAGEPEIGDNAIYHLIDEIEKIGLVQNDIQSILELLKSKFAAYDGASLGIKNDSEYYMGEFVGNNTISVTRLEIHENTLWFHADIRYTYGTDPEHIQGILQDVMSPYEGTVSKFLDMPPAFVKSDKKFLKVLNEVYKNETGIDAGCVTSTGGTYAQAMPNIVTWGPTFPGTKDTCHEENECMTEEVLEKIYRMYSEALKSLALSEESYL